MSGHWGTDEALLALAGASLILVSLLMREATAAQRLKGAAGGVLLIGYGAYVASQTSGIFFIPVYAILLGFAAPLLLLRDVYARRKRQAVPTVSAGSAGARRCLSCGRAYASSTAGPCPTCRGTLTTSPSTRKGAR